MDYKSKYKHVSPFTYGKKYAEHICSNLSVDALSALRQAHEDMEKLKKLLF
jgi:hypothetical protein